MLYDLVKAGHIIAVVMWFGGMIAAALALTSNNRSAIPHFQAWDRRVTTPCLILTWILGVMLALAAGWFASGWLTAKLVFVLAVSGIHGVLSGKLRRAASGLDVDDSSIRRLALPSMTVCLCAIVLLVVAKPI